MSATSNDDLLAELLDAFTQQMRAGEQPDIEAAIREHPELADELRELWGAVMVADAVAAHSSRNSQALDPRGFSKTGDVPRQQPSGGSHVALPALLGDYELLAELGRGGMG